MYQSNYHPTLYVPATRRVSKLLGLVNGTVNIAAWRVVLCTEDAVHEHEVPTALDHIKRVLAEMNDDSEICVFVRVRTPEVLKQVLDFEGVEKLTGFVIPKADPEDFPKYADQVCDTEFRLMPILEHPHTYERGFREMLRTVLMDRRYVGLIDCLRIGANDLMGHLGIRRDTSEFTVYDTPVGMTIHSIINEFRGTGGFTITAPVFECYGPRYDDLFRKEVRLHMMNGLYGQTVIHTRHLRPIRDMYKVPFEDYTSAKEIREGATAVKGKHERMDEHSTHIRWAELTIARYELFGSDLESQTLVDKVQ